VALLLPLALSTLATFAYRPPLRSALARDMIGFLSRMQLLFVFSVPWIAGFYMIGASDSIDREEIALAVAGLVWIFGVMVMMAGQAHASTDRHRRRVERALAVTAASDPLTGLSNRRGAELSAAAVLGGPRLGGSPIPLFLIDLDHFKAINDRHGHHVGDLVLRRVGQVLRSRLRRGDIVARWGGEEFLALLPGASPEAAQGLADELRRAIAAISDVPDGKGGSVGVTASFGGAFVGAVPDSFSAAVRRADAALYRAKGQGRDRVEIDTALPRLHADLAANRSEALAPARSGVAIPDRGKTAP